MIKNLTSVGNSKAVILPSEMIKKYNLEKVILEELEEGILIRSAATTSKFQKAVDKLRKYKAGLYQKIEKQALDPTTVKYYSNPANNFGDVDLEIK